MEVKLAKSAGVPVVPMALKTDFLENESLILLLFSKKLVFLLLFCLSAHFLLVPFIFIKIQKGDLTEGIVPSSCWLFLFAGSYSIIVSRYRKF